MPQIIIENVPQNVYKKYGGRIPFSHHISFDGNSKKSPLLEYLNSDEYKNDVGDIFNSPEDLLSDLKRERTKLGK